MKFSNLQITLSRSEKLIKENKIVFKLTRREFLGVPTHRMEKLRKAAGAEQKKEESGFMNMTRKNFLKLMTVLGFTVAAPNVLSAKTQSTENLKMSESPKEALLESFLGKIEGAKQVLAERLARMIDLTKTPEQLKAMGVPENAIQEYQNTQDINVLIPYVDQVDFSQGEEARKVTFTTLPTEDPQGMDDESQAGETDGTDTKENALTPEQEKEKEAMLDTYTDYPQSFVNSFKALLESPDIALGEVSFVLGSGGVENEPAFHIRTEKNITETDVVWVVQGAVMGSDAWQLISGGNAPLDLNSQDNRSTFIHNDKIKIPPLDLENPALDGLVVVHGCQDSTGGFDFNLYPILVEAPDQITEQALVVSYDGEGRATISSLSYLKQGFPVAKTEAYKLGHGGKYEQWHHVSSSFEVQNDGELTYTGVDGEKLLKETIVAIHQQNPETGEQLVSVRKLKLEHAPELVGELTVESKTQTTLNVSFDLPRDYDEDAGGALEVAVIAYPVSASPPEEADWQNLEFSSLPEVGKNGRCGMSVKETFPDSHSLQSGTQYRLIGIIRKSYGENHSPRYSAFSELTVRTADAVSEPSTPTVPVFPEPELC